MMQNLSGNDEMVSAISEEESAVIEDELASFEFQIEPEALACNEVSLTHSANCETFDSFANPVQHSKITEKAYSFEDCTKSVHIKNDVPQHVDTHGRKRFKCPVCGLYLKSKSNLNVHQQRHSAVKSFQCNICEKCFATNYDLQHHSKIHQKQPIRYHCEICGKDFGRIYTLKNHMNVHEPVPENKCNQCGKVFPHRRNLLLHERTHLVEAMFGENM